MALQILIQMYRHKPKLPMKRFKIIYVKHMVFIEGAVKLWQ